MVLLLIFIEEAMRAFIFRDSLLWAKPSLPVGIEQVDQYKLMPSVKEPEWSTKCGLLELFS